MMLPFSIFALLAIAGVGLSSVMPSGADASDEVEDDFVDEPMDDTDVLGDDGDEPTDPSYLRSAKMRISLR